MMEQTLVIIKPDAVKRKLVGRIIQRFEDRGLTIKKLCQTTLNENVVKAHYEHLKEKDFFQDIIDYMTSGPVVILQLESKQVVQITRKMIGETNAATAAPGTIRGDFAVSMTENVIHASDSVDSARIEIKRFFD